MYDYDYIAGETTKAAANVAGTLIWTIIAFIIAIAAGIMVYFMFVKSDKQVSENLKKLKDLYDVDTKIIQSKEIKPGKFEIEILKTYTDFLDE